MLESRNRTSAFKSRPPAKYNGKRGRHSCSLIFYFNFTNAVTLYLLHGTPYPRRGKHAPRVVVRRSVGCTQSLPISGRPAARPRAQSRGSLRRMAEGCLQAMCCQKGQSGVGGADVMKKENVEHNIKQIHRDHPPHKRYTWSTARNAGVRRQDVV